MKTRVVCKQSEGTYELPVIRQGGSDGQAIVQYHIESKESEICFQSLLRSD